MTEITPVELNGIRFYMVCVNNEEVRTLWQTLEQAKEHTGLAYAVVMPNKEVISYGVSMGFIKEVQ